MIEIKINERYLDFWLKYLMEALNILMYNPLFSLAQHQDNKDFQIQKQTSYDGKKNNAYFVMNSG